MISRIKVQNFRLLRDVNLEIAEGVPVVLIGPNSSGKSSILEVLDFLSDAIKNGLQHAVYKQRQGISQIRTAGTKDDICIEVEILSKKGWPTEPEGGKLGYTLKFTEWSPGQLAITEEKLVIFKREKDDPPLVVLEQKDMDQGGFGIVRKKDNPPLVVLDRKNQQTSVLNVQTRNHDQVGVSPAAQALVAIQQSTLYPTLDHVRQILGMLSVYPGFSTLPLWGRESQEQDISPRNSQYIVPTTRIGKRGVDLTTALYHIFTHHAQTVWFQLEKHFRQEFPYVRRVFFPVDSGGGRIALGWEDERFGGTTFYGTQMSEGMISYLCLLAAILAPDLAAALGFDEPDRHIHPSAIRRLVFLLEERAKSTAILIATHSNDLLDHLDNPAASVVICSPTKHGVRLDRLNPDALNTWREEYSLSLLRQQGQLDPANTEIDRG